MFASLQKRTIELLRWSERYIKTDMVYLTSGTFWLTVGQLSGTLAGLILTIAFGNLVSKDAYGNYRYILSLVGLFGTFTLTGIGSAVAQAVARGYDGTLRVALRTDLLWNIPSVILMLGGSAYYYANGNADLALALAVAAIGSAILSATNLCYSFLQGKHDFRRQTIYGFALSAAPLFLIPLMFLGYAHSATTLILVYYIAMIAASVFSYIRTLTVYRPGGATDPATIPYAFHLSYISFLGRIASYIDSVLVFHFLGAEMLAVYTFAEAPPQAILRFNNVFQTMALPKLASRDMHSIKRELPRKMFLHFLATVPVLVAYVIAVPYAFRIFFPKYMDSVLYAQVLGLTLLSAPGVWIGQTLIAHMRKKALYFVNIVNPALKIALYLFFIPIWGIWGMIAAVIISGFVGFLIAPIVYMML